MQIFVKGPNQTKVFEVERDENGEHLKGKVEESFGIAADFQSLSYRGKQVVADSKLRAVLTDGCTVHLALPMFGGFSGGAAEIADGWLDLYSFDDMVGYAPERPGGLPERTRPVAERVAESQDIFVDVPALPDDDLAGFDMDAESMDFLNDTVQTCDVSAPNKPIHDMAYTTDSSVSTPNDDERLDSPCSVDPDHIAQCDGGGGDAPSSDFSIPTSFNVTVYDGDLEVEQKPKRTKGVAFDLDSVDDKMRRRLIKNRQSAERSRLKKNAMMKGLEDELHKTRMENVVLKRECENAKNAQMSLLDENESLRALLQAHGLSLDAAPAHVA